MAVEVVLFALVVVLAAALSIIYTHVLHVAMSVFFGGVVPDRVFLRLSLPSAASSSSSTAAAKRKKAAAAEEEEKEDSSNDTVLVSAAAATVDQLDIFLLQRIRALGDESKFSSSNQLKELSVETKRTIAAAEITDQYLLLKHSSSSSSNSSDGDDDDEKETSFRGVGWSGFFRAMPERLQFRLCGLICRLTHSAAVAGLCLASGFYYYSSVDPSSLIFLRSLIGNYFTITDHNNHVVIDEVQYNSTGDGINRDELVGAALRMAVFALITDFGFAAVCLLFCLFSGLLGQSVIRKVGLSFPSFLCWLCGLVAFAAAVALDVTVMLVHVPVIAPVSSSSLQAEDNAGAQLPIFLMTLSQQRYESYTNWAAALDRPELLTMAAAVAVLFLRAASTAAQVATTVLCKHTPLRRTSVSRFFLVAALSVVLLLAHAYVFSVFPGQQYMALKAASSSFPFPFPSSSFDFADLADQAIVADAAVTVLAVLYFVFQWLSSSFFGSRGGEKDDEVIAINLDASGLASDSSTSDSRSTNSNTTTTTSRSQEKTDKKRK